MKSLSGPFTTKSFYSLTYHQNYNDGYKYNQYKNINNSNMKDEKYLRFKYHIILIYESKFKFHPFFKDVTILSDLISVVSTPILNNNFLLRFDISKINYSSYLDINNIELSL